MTEQPLVEISALDISFTTKSGRVDAVRGVSFTMGRERLGIVGESGSGKSLTARCLLGILPANAEVRSRHIVFDGIRVDTAGEAEMRRLRGRRIGMILQDPKYSLNPLLTVSQQLCEMFSIHRVGNRAEARAKAIDLLRAVGFTDADRVMASYPHELSGGMGQRAMIAMMLMTDPDLIVADEPTSALDVTVKLKVLDTMDRMVRERRMGLVLISHDLNLVAAYCDRILIMYRGRVVETLNSPDLAAARHPYTRALVDSLPRLDCQVDRLKTLDRGADWTRWENAGA
jgi:peptide/nickel transport system ATP-binding protein